MDYIKQKWLALRIALAGWIYTAPVRRHDVPDDWYEIELDRGTERAILDRIQVGHGGILRVFSSTEMDRHMAAARRGATIPPYELRRQEFKSGAVLLDYSKRGRDTAETWPPDGADPLAGEAEPLRDGLSLP